ncbi:MAG: DEAD/DEAH box helicase [Desulfobacterales bacterium]
MVLSIFQKIRNKIRNLTKRDKKRGGEDTASPESRSEIGLKTEKNGEAPEEIPAESRTRKRRRRKKTKDQTLPAAIPAHDSVQREEHWDISMFEMPPAEGKMRFHDLNLPPEIMHAIADLGFQYCSPIQAEILPATLNGKDASGQAQTGTGKTAAFLITVLTHFLRNPLSGRREFGTPRALVLAPTRELVMQIAEEAELLAKYCPMRIVSIFGGMDYQKQRRQLSDQAVDIVVATPGRLIDFCEHYDVHLEKVEVLVIDEADRMLDMGFIPQVRRIVRETPHKDRRQTLFFSATMTGEVERLASQWTTDPLTVEVEPEQVEVASVEQIVYLVTSKEKFALLYNIIVRQDLRRVIIFCNQRAETQRIADLLKRSGINCEVISGEVPQKKRMHTLEKFRSGTVRVLVATDVAGRGLHIEGVSHVVNYSLPHEPENYVHRIGRTGRAGATGTSISFACEEDSFYLPEIEKFLGHSLSCTQPEEEWLVPPTLASPQKKTGEKRKYPPRRAPSRSQRRPRNSGRP